MKRNIIIILLIAFLLYFFPFLQEVPTQKQYDLEWDLIHRQQNIKEFDSKSFSFVRKTTASEAVKALDGKEISIHGFVNYNKDSAMYITEMPSDLCFFCGEDHYHGAIFIRNKPYNPTYPPNAYIVVKGRFIVENDTLSNSKLYINQAIISLDTDKPDTTNYARTHTH